MKLCAACHQDLPKDKFSKKQWKLGAQSQRRCTSCVRDNREVQQSLTNDNNDESVNNKTGIVSLLDSMSIENLQTISDEDIFKQHNQGLQSLPPNLPPNYEDCPICFLQMPCLSTGYKYMACCGKTICSGCIYANIRLGDLCPFCRTLSATTDKEINEWLKKRMQVNDICAIFSSGCGYSLGMYGFSRNNIKALELWHRAGELGHPQAYLNIGASYYNGDTGVQRDMKKAQYYFGLAAKRGDLDARYNLGLTEEETEEDFAIDRALKHYMIAASGGHSGSLRKIKHLFTDGYATKDDYGTALRAHQSYLDEVRSKQRDEAAKYDEKYKYY